jgi:hypothetical protein
VKYMVAVMAMMLPSSNKTHLSRLRLNICVFPNDLERMDMNMMKGVSIMGGRGNRVEQ